MSSPNLTFADALPSLGEDTGSPITVRISNEILTLLSSQLYQSPLKAIEELVVNSYDADSNECRLFVPKPDDDLQVVLVYDDGIGMDADGLSDLWLVGRSSKREPAYERRMDRKQIGKFGIGKLATYAISNNITYISRTDSDVLAVSADFEKFREGPGGYYARRTQRYPRCVMGQTAGTRNLQVRVSSCRSGDQQALRCCSRILDHCPLGEYEAQADSSRTIELGAEDGNAVASGILPISESRGNTEFEGRCRCPLADLM